MSGKKPQVKWYKKRESPHQEEVEVVDGSYKRRFVVLGGQFLIIYVTPLTVSLVPHLSQNLPTPMCSCIGHSDDNLNILQQILKLVKL